MSLINHIIESTTPVKKTWKPKPSRSLGLPSGDEWSRHLEGFAIPSQLNTKTKRQIKHSASNITGKYATRLKEDVHHSPADISDYSSSESSDDDRFNEIKPLSHSPVSPGHLEPVHHHHHQQHPVAKATPKRGVKRRLCVNHSEQVLDNTGSSFALTTCAVQSKDKPQGLISVNSPSNRQKQTLSQQSNSSVQNYSIYDFDTQTPTSKEDASPHQTKSSDVETELASISSTSALQSELDAGERKLRSSEWLRNLQWMPDDAHQKAAVENQQTSLEDSAKKSKRKYCKGGLADRLQKLLRRKNSTQNIWNHKMAMPQQTSSADVSKVLTVELVETRVEFSTLLTKCHVTAPSTGKAATLETAELITVLFSLETAKRLSLKKSSVVQIHPPWQDLNSPTGNKVILCTLFCCLLPGQNDTTGNDAMSATGGQHDDGAEAQQSGVEGHVVATWKCPCSEDGTFPNKGCLAAVTPCDSALLSRVSGSRQLSSGGGDSAKSQSPHCQLHTELVSQGSSQGDTGILESVENQGGFGTCGITLRAIVQRVFYRRTAVSSSEKSPRTPSRLTSPRPRQCFSSSPPGVSDRQRISLLLQDSSGTCCEVALPPRAELLDRWRPLCEGGEGAVWSFSGLRQNYRTNKNRDPCLFNVIESVHPAEGLAVPANSSQSDSQQSSPRHVSHVSQAFCYRLVAPSGESSCRLVGPGSGYRASVHYKLADVAAAVTRKPRLTVTCKVILTQSQGVVSPQQWYVVDDSLRAQSASGSHGYCKVTVQVSCWLSPAVHEELKSTTPLLLLKDVAMQNGLYFCDGYSRVYPACHIASIQHQLIEYSELAGTSRLRAAPTSIAHLSDVTCISTTDLVLVSGDVTGVNESAAYTWDECDKCRSSNLHPHPDLRHALFCPRCKQPVVAPLVGISLEVYVQVRVALQTSAVCAKIKLLQPTIEAFLPEESDEEGYEVQSVLGRVVGPLPCLVMGTLQKAPTPSAGLRELKEVHLQQVSLNT